MSNHLVDIIPTAVPRTIDELIEAAQRVTSFSKKIHVDMDDGVFVPQVSWPYVGADMYGKTDTSMIEHMWIEAHLMVHDPHMLGVDLARNGVCAIIGHVETCADKNDAEDMLTMWRTCGAQEVGLAIRIETPMERIIECASFCDVVQIMSVAKIGAQGALFDPRAIERIRTLRKAHPDVIISVDGGINDLTIVDVIRAGAMRVCAGSAVMMTSDPGFAYRQLEAAAHRAEEVPATT
jgi:ribulose-phosphate 3-epimerase